MKAKYHVKPGAKFPAPPAIEWALFLPNRGWENFLMYSTKTHAKAALKPMWARDTTGARLFQWVDGEWVERSFDE